MTNGQKKEYNPGAVFNNGNNQLNNGGLINSMGKQKEAPSLKRNMTILEKSLSVFALLVSLILFSLYAWFSFIVFMFAGMSGDAAETMIALLLPAIHAIAAFFVLVQMSRIVQGKMAINIHWIFLFFLIIENIIFLFIPLDIFSINGIPRSIFYNIFS